MVTGGGPIGLLTAVVAQALGASLVAVSEPAPHRRELAAALGIDQVFDPTRTDTIETGIEISAGGFDKVFEASGAEPALMSAFDLARRGATIVQIGTIAGNHVTLPVNELMLREISLLGTFRYADEFPQAIRLAASPRLDVLPSLITGVYPLRDIQRAMERACRGDDSLKVQLTVSD